MTDVSMRLAEPRDMPAVFMIFSDAMEDMNRRGILQWDQHYPTHTILEDDLAQGQLYVGETEQGVVSAVVLNGECDPQYTNATWLGTGPYVIVHRLCVTPAAQGAGVGRGLMAAVEVWVRARGYAEIRLDVFSQNPHAIRMYTYLGYEKRGEAHWRKGLFYLMEKRLADTVQADG